MKIVVRGANWIGDSVMTVPALRALREIFPGDHITLHTRSWAEGIFRDVDLLDEVLTYERPTSSLAEVVGQASTLRQHEFDVAVIFPNSFSSALMMRFAGVPRRFGFSNDGRRFVLTDPIQPLKSPSERHEVFNYLELIRNVEQTLLGTTHVDTVTPDTTVPISETRRQKAIEYLGRVGVDLSRPIVALGAGSTNSVAKRWPFERFAQLADELVDLASANILLLGGPDDVEVARKILRTMRQKVVDLTAKTSLGNAAAILSVTDLTISNDMGLAHLAPAVGSQTLVIFGPTNPTTTRPFSELAEVIREDVECSPCMLRECPIDHRCMNRITVRRVLDLAIARLTTNDRLNTTATSSISGS